MALLGCPADKTSETKEKGKGKAPLPSQAVEHLAQGQKFLQDRKLDEALKEIPGNRAPGAGFAGGLFLVGAGLFLS